MFICRFDGFAPKSLTRVRAALAVVEKAARPLTMEVETCMMKIAIGSLSVTILFFDHNRWVYMATYLASNLPTLQLSRPTFASGFGLVSEVIKVPCIV